MLVDLTPDRAPELVRELVAGGVQVHEVGSVERTLEEVFFEMTRNELEEADEHVRHDAPRTRAMTARSRALGAELLRLRKWPAVWVTIGAWLALTAMFGYLFNYIRTRRATHSFSNEGVPRRACWPRSCRRTSPTCCSRACRCSAAR